MMTWTEVGVALARKAGSQKVSKDKDAEKTRVMSRVFANDVAQLVAQNSLKIIMGTGQFEQPAIAEFLEKISYHELITGCRNVIADMDRIADMLFGR
jgi:hypothetical protein